MSDWFDTLSTGSELPAEAASELHQNGFVVLPGLVPCERVEQLAGAYDSAMLSARDAELKIGSSSTRVNDFVNRGEEFDAMYILPALLDACCRIIGRPFKLSSFHARTVRPRSRGGELHVDVRRDSADWPLLGFILMVDDFRPENGATRFVPGSHRCLSAPEDAIFDLRANYEGQVLACGPSGSLLIFNGSAWHDHSPNTSDQPRRSLQGAFIPRDGQSGCDFTARMPPETRARLRPIAQYVLAL